MLLINTELKSSLKLRPSWHKYIWKSLSHPWPTLPHHSSSLTTTNDKINLEMKSSNKNMGRTLKPHSHWMTVLVASSLLWQDPWQRQRRVLLTCQIRRDDVCYVREGKETRAWWYCPWIWSRNRKRWMLLLRAFVLLPQSGTPAQETLLSTVHAQVESSLHVNSHNHAQVSKSSTADNQGEPPSAGVTITDWSHMLTYDGAICRQDPHFLQRAFFLTYTSVPRLCADPSFQIQHYNKICCLTFCLQIIPRAIYFSFYSTWFR